MYQCVNKTALGGFKRILYVNNNDHHFKTDFQPTNVHEISSPRMY